MVKRKRRSKRRKRSSFQSGAEQLNKNLMAAGTVIVGSAVVAHVAARAKDIAK